MRKVILACLILTLNASSYAATTTRKLELLSERLISDYQAKKPSQKTTLAIFAFNTDQKLAKKKIGFAVAETMSHKFVSNGLFTVVERTEINKVMAEQKLQASGIVENSAAVRLGQILGAKTLLLGNVQRVGTIYQVNARLVDVQSAEVIASSYEELLASAFEEEARDYIVYVPDTQVLGIYFLYNYRHNANSLPDTAYIGALSSPIEDSPKAFNLGLLGGGIRYAPTSKLLIDFSLMESASSSKAGTWRYQLYGSWGWRTAAYNIKVNAYRGLINLKIKMADNFICYPGAGLTLYSISGDASGKYSTPTISTRFEYFIQSRVGISLAGGYDFNSKSAKERTNFLGEGSGTDNKRVKLDRFYLEPTISLYF